MTPDPAPPDAARPSPWRWWVCILLLLATTLNYMDRMALNQTAVRIQAAFGLDNVQYGWLESVFSIAFAVGAVTTGFVVDRVSVRWVYPLVVLGWSLAGVATGFVGTFAGLLLCRFLLGLFEAGNWPCGIRTTKAVLPPAERSLGNGLFQSGTALGAVITPLLVLGILRWTDPGEPERLAQIAAGGGTAAAVVGTTLDSWRVPFRMIGMIGFVWIALWFLTIPAARIRPPAEAAAADPAGDRFAAVFRDRRFWMLLVMVTAINVTWHTFRAWLPPMLQRERGYSEGQMAWLMTAYYLAADFGSWTVGFATLALTRGGWSVFASRRLAFLGCSLLVLGSFAVPFLPSGRPLEACLLVIAFGALGLFPTYFALSQDISAKHQGKVTGTLGAGTHLFLAAIYPIQGLIVEKTHSYQHSMMLIGLPPLIALLILWRFWPAGEPRTHSP